MVEIVLPKLGMYEGAAATPVPFSPPLEDAYLPSAPRIVAACRSVM